MYIFLSYMFKFKVLELHIVDSDFQQNEYNILLNLIRYFL